MIIEIDDREIEVDEEDLSSLLDVLNKQYDPTIILMANLETVLNKVSKDISAAIKSIPQPKDPIPPPKEMTVKVADNAVPKMLTSIESMINKMSNNVVAAVQSIPTPVITAQKETSIVMQEPVKRIIVGEIERNNNGLIRSCVLEVER